MREYDLVIIGGGASGILCGIEAKKKNINSILIIEKDPVLGGMLSSSDYNIGGIKCITGKEYKEKILNELNEFDIEINLNTMALKIEENNEIVCTSTQRGIEKIRGNKIILVNGSKEKSRNVVSMIGSRTSGILTVGMAKKIFGLGNMIPGKDILIIGDATLYIIENELKNYNVNVVGIVCGEGNADKIEKLNVTKSIYEGYDLIDIDGEGRVSKVKIQKNDEIKEINCDTVIFSYPMLSDGVVSMRSGIDLNPCTTGPKVDENYKTSRDDIYACGNGIFIHETIWDIERECKILIEKINI